MKKSHIAIAALPVIFGAAGYGAGQVFAPAPKPPHVVADDRTDAEKVLDGLAEGDTHRSAEEHGVSTPSPDDAHAPVQHDARLIPAKAEGHAATAGAPAIEPAPQHAPVQAQDTHAAPAPRMASADAGHRKGTSPMSVGRVTVELAPGQKGTMSAKHMTDSKVVKLGRVTVPVQRPGSVTYVVSDIGVAVTDLDAAAHFNQPENATRLRDAILMSMHKIAGTSALKGVRIDTTALAESMSDDLKAGFGNKVEEVLFLSLYKADVPRS